MNVNAGQLIYGNIEKELSPKKEAGLQTFFHTHALLTEEQVADVQGKLAYYPGDTTTPVKRLFFSVEKDRFIVARIVPTQQVDMYGRQHGYLAHCLIFTAEDFVKLECNPWFAFRYFESEFFNSVEQALQSAHQGAEIGSINREIPMESLKTFEKDMITESNKWDVDQLVCIIDYAITYRDIEKNKRSVAFLGDTADIESALIAAFALMPPEVRLNCSFDTHYYKISDAAHYFWSRCYPSISGIPSHFMPVDAKARTIVKGSSKPASQSPYHRWLLTTLLKHDDIAIIKDREMAFQVHKLLLGETHNSAMLGKIDENLAADFISTNDSLVGALIKKNLETLVGVNLTPHILEETITRSRTQDKKGVILTLSHGFELNKIAWRLAFFFKNRRPTESELAELKGIGMKSQDPLLGYMTLFWSKDYDGLKTKLQKEADSTLVGPIAWLFIGEHHMPASELVCPGRADVIVQAFLESTGSESHFDEVPRLVASLIRVREQSSLCHLEPLLKYLDAKQLKAVRKAIDRQEFIPESFISSLNAALEARDNGRELRINIKGFFRR